MHVCRKQTAFALLWCYKDSRKIQEIRKNKVMFAYSGGREYIFLCRLSGLPFFAFQCVVGSTLRYCKERRGLKTFGFLMLLSLHLSIRGLLSELICWVFMWQMNKFAVLKQNKPFFFFYPEVGFGFRAAPSQRGSAGFSLVLIHTAKHSEMKHTTLLYMLTPSQDCVKHTHTALWHHLESFSQNKCLH